MKTTKKTAIAIITAALILVSVFAMGGCTGDGEQTDTTAAPISTTAANADELKFEKKIYTTAPNTASSISIEYPEFTGSGSEELNAIISKNLDAYAKIGDADFAEDALTIDYKCEVTLLNDSFVSTVFWGSSNVEGAAHPNTDLMAVNVRRSDMKELAFTDMYTVGDGFSELFFEKAYYPTAPVTSFEEARFAEMLQLQTPENKALDVFDYPEDIEFFLKADSIVISLSSAHATGFDHFEAELKYADISSFAVTAQ